MIVPAQRLRGDRRMKNSRPDRPPRRNTLNAKPRSTNFETRRRDKPISQLCRGNGAIPSRKSNPHEMLHLLLFLWESCEGNNAETVERDCLRFFFRRTGGFHLLLMLLNAHYNKPQVGRRPGWQFCVLHDRIRISKRALRTLIHDAQAECLVQQLLGVRDRRSRTYVLAPQVVEAWERMVSELDSSLTDIFASCSPHQLANADYRGWDPNKPASLQIQNVIPYHLPHRS